MAYISAADMRQATRQPWAADVVLGPNDGSDPDIDSVIARVTTQIELGLHDDFEPPSPDNDEVLKVDSYGGERLYLPRRCRSITSLQTRDPVSSTMTTQGATTYYHRKSLNAANTAMLDGRRSDWLEALSGFSLGCWPWGTETVWITGKFGWAAVPDDIKRLVALHTYDQVKRRADPLGVIQQRITLDATLVLGPSREMAEIVALYQRDPVFVG